MKKLKNLFIHLHTHHSILDSFTSLDEYKTYFKNDIFGVSDHGNIRNIVDLYKGNKRLILGNEFYFKEKEEDKKWKYHLPIWALNQKGLENLIKLNNLSMERFYYKPTLTLKDLEQYNEGLLVGCGCLRGVFYQNFETGDFSLIEKLHNIFDKNFFIEIYLMPQYQKFYEDNRFYEILLKYDLNVLFSIDIHFIDEQDLYIQKFILSIRNKKEYQEDTYDWAFIEDLNKRMERLNFQFSEAFYNAHNYFVDYILGNFTGYNIDIDFIKNKEKYNQILIKLVNELIKKKKINKTELERLKYELKQIISLGLSEQFVIARRIAKILKKLNIEYDIRGSGAGSYLLHLLDLLSINPIKYNGNFERFINPYRSKLADIDIDIEEDKRENFIEELKKEYFTYKIYTLHKFRIKQIFNDLLRFNFFDKQKLLKYSKFIVENNLDEAIKVIDDEKIKNLVSKIYGKIRSISRHPCGFIVSKEPIHNYFGFSRVEQEKLINLTEGREENYIEDFNLFKFDFLKSHSLKLIKQLKQKYPLKENFEEDKNLYLSLKENQDCIFMFETGKWDKLIKYVNPQNFRDLIHLNALNRPDILKSGETQRYILKKKNLVEGKENNPLLDKILSSTHGCLIFQEQITEILKYFGFDNIEADLIRHKITKGRVDEEVKEKIKKLPEEIKKKIMNMGTYLFNYNHSLIYAYRSLIILYYRYYYPLDFTLTYLNSYERNIEKITNIFNFIVYKKIKTEIPSLDRLNYYAEKEGNTIYLGFNLLNYISEKVLNEIKRAGDIMFCKKRIVNKRVREILDKLEEIKITTNKINKIKLALQIFNILPPSLALDFNKDYCIVYNIKKDFINKVFFYDPRKRRYLSFKDPSGKITQKGIYDLEYFNENIIKILPFVLV